MLSAFKTTLGFIFLVDAKNMMMIEVTIRVQQRPRPKKEKTRFLRSDQESIPSEMFELCPSGMEFEFIGTNLGIES